ncbi:MAG: hypothetical protein PVH75_07085 [Syntrophobacterales bacterium]
MRQGNGHEMMTIQNSFVCLIGMALASNVVQATVSLGRFNGRLELSLQCFHDSEPVALVTEKVRSPWNEIISFPFHHKGIGGSTIGTLRLRVRFHFPCSFFSAERVQGDQREANWRLGGVARAGNAAWFQVRVNLLIMSIRKTTILLRQAALSVRRIVKSG